MLMMSVFCPEKCVDEIMPWMLGINHNMAHYENIEVKFNKEIYHILKYSNKQ